MDAMEFGEAVLENLESLVPDGAVGGDLALELGLCAWMHWCNTDLDGAVDELWAVRRALLAVGRLDPATEPVPLLVREPRSAVIMLSLYLRTLLTRAATHRGVDRATLVGLARDELRSIPSPFRTHHLVRRSS